MCTHTYTYKHTYTYIHIYTYIHTLTYTNTHTNTHTHTHSYTHTHAHTYTHSYTHTHTHTCTHTHMQTSLIKTKVQTRDRMPINHAQRYVCRVRARICTQMQPTMITLEGHCRMAEIQGRPRPRLCLWATTLRVRAISARANQHGAREHVR